MIVSEVLASMAIDNCGETTFMNACNGHKDVVKWLGDVFDDFQTLCWNYLSFKTRPKGPIIVLIRFWTTFNFDAFDATK